MSTKALQEAIKNTAAYQRGGYSTVIEIWNGMNNQAHKAYNLDRLRQGLRDMRMNGELDYKDTGLYRRKSAATKLIRGPWRDYEHSDVGQFTRLGAA